MYSRSPIISGRSSPNNAGRVSVGKDNPSLVSWATSGELVDIYKMGRNPNFYCQQWEVWWLLEQGSQTFTISRVSRTKMLSLQASDERWPFVLMSSNINNDLNEPDENCLWLKLTVQTVYCSNHKIIFPKWTRFWYKHKSKHLLMVQNQAPASK